MKQLTFRKIKIVKDIDKESIKEGEYFLYGDAMSAQIQTKEPGQQISYFKCIKADEKGKNIEYMLITDTLDE